MAYGNSTPTLKKREIEATIDAAGSTDPTATKKPLRREAGRAEMESA